MNRAERRKPLHFCRKCNTPIWAKSHPERDNMCYFCWSGKTPSPRTKKEEMKFWDRLFKGRIFGKQG